MAVNGRVVQHCYSILFNDTVVNGSRIALLAELVNHVSDEEAALATSIVTDFLAVGFACVEVNAATYELKVLSMRDPENHPVFERGQWRLPGPRRRRNRVLHLLNEPHEANPTSVCFSLLRRHAYVLELEGLVLRSNRLRAQPLLILERESRNAVATDTPTYNVYQRHAEGYEPDQVLGLTQEGAELVRMANDLRLENVKLVREKAQAVNETARRNIGRDSWRKDAFFETPFLYNAGEHPQSSADALNVFPVPPDFRPTGINPIPATISISEVQKERLLFEDSVRLAFGVAAQFVGTTTPKAAAEMYRGQSRAVVLLYLKAYRDTCLKAANVLDLNEQ